MRRSGWVVVAAMAVALVAGIAGCGGAAGETSGSASGSGGGTVHVLYAGSLVNMMEHDLGPKFATASGDTYRGQGKGSTELAQEIKGKVHAADVFISADPDVNSTLMGKANGDWVSWYATFATAPLVLGYNPRSDYAADLKAKPWYRVLTEPGIKVGRTDPRLDPKGALTVKALQQAQQDYHVPGLAAEAKKAEQVFPEQDLVGRLQAGQLDAGFFYRNEATEQDLPTISLGKVKLGATYTVTVLNRAENPTAAKAFLRYLLGAKGKAVLAAHGLKVVTPRVTGDVPASLRQVVTGG